MKIGDLVKYKAIVQGLDGRIGIIVDWNGAFPVVLWNDARREVAVIDLIEVVR
tara:strand:- start:1991 stop:2149 length:159 start_codon:yes stop_codon:yes gene_type:complete